MRHFSSLEEIQKATLEKLKEIPEMNEASAQAVVDFFVEKRNEEKA